MSPTRENVCVARVGMRFGGSNALGLIVPRKVSISDLTSLF